MSPGWLAALAVLAVLASLGVFLRNTPAARRPAVGLVVGILLTGLVVSAGAGLVGADVGSTTGQSPGAENPAVLASNHTDGEMTTVEGGPEFEVVLQTTEFESDNESDLILTLTNTGEADADAPPEIQDRLTAASTVTVALSDAGGTGIQTSPSEAFVGDIAGGAQQNVTLGALVPADAEPGEHTVAFTINYEEVSELSYRVDDNGTRQVDQQTSQTNVTREFTIVITEGEEAAGSDLPLALIILGPILPGAIIVTWLVGRSHEPTAETLNRVGRVTFGRFISPHTERERRIEAAYIDTTYRTYAAKTLLFAMLAFVGGTILGAYIVGALLAVLQPLVRTLAGLPRTITRPVGIHPDYVFQVSQDTWWLIVIGGGIILGVLGAGLAYMFRWQIPASQAEVRRRGINEGLARTTAFMYALSRGGMEFPQIVRILTEHKEVYGETANEMSVTVREMDLFGRDMISALRRMSQRTPSERFKTFSENLTSILQSGSDLSTFFNNQYERFRDEAEERQQEVLEFLSTIAEAYVTIFVAGVLFFITILLVFGLTVADTLWLLQVIIYAMIPLANAGFAVFLQQQLSALGITHHSDTGVLERMDAATPVNPSPATEKGRADGGVSHAMDQENRRMLALYDRVSRIKQALQSPLEVLLWNPTKIFYITVPIAIVALAVRAPAAFRAEGVTLRVLDDFVIQSVIFLLVTYAIVRFVHKRHISRIESATPEMLERLASLNEAGMSVVQGLDRVRGSDLGVLTPEIERIWRDIEYGSNVDDALIRFGRRVRTTAIVRVVTLLTNAMRASGQMGPVLRIASEQARAELRLKQQRRQQMITYLIVIYVSFFVFLVIILAVNEVLVPSLPDAVATPQGGEAKRLGASPDSIARFGEVDKAAYTLIFFHAALIQALAAGFIGGQLGEGSLRDGAKHAAAMLAMAYLVFVLISAPIASVNLESQQIQSDGEIYVYEGTTDGSAVFEIDKVSLSDGGYIAIYGADDGINGTLLGHTEFLPPGTHTDLVIPLDNEITEDRSVRFVVHQDTNGNEEFDFEGPYQPAGNQPDRPYSSPTEEGEPGLEINLLYIGE
jgi:flagellar protein FlaJ